MWQFGVNSGNGALIAAGRQTTDDGGSFGVEVVAPDLAGPDRVVAEARNTQTGETCRGALIR